MPSHVTNVNASPPTRARRMVGADEYLARPVRPAELAQARSFEVILQAEFARLDHLANGTAGPLERLKPADTGSAQLHRDLTQIHARIDEVRRLLDALQNRFLHVRLDNDRQPSECAETPS
jgi:hypothetical protein